MCREVFFLLLSTTCLKLEIQINAKYCEWRKKAEKKLKKYFEVVWLENVFRVLCGIEIESGAISATRAWKENIKATLVKHRTSCKFSKKYIRRKICAHIWRLCVLNSSRFYVHTRYTWRNSQPKNSVFATTLSTSFARVKLRMLIIAITSGVRVSYAVSRLNTWCFAVADVLSSERRKKKQKKPQCVCRLE